MSYILLEIPIKTGIELTVPEYYRIYTGQDLLVERTIHWDSKSYYVNEKLVIKTSPVILLRIESTSKNINLNAVSNQDVPKIIDIPYIKLNENLIYPKILREIVNKSKIFSLVNILYITV